MSALRAAVAEVLTFGPMYGERWVYDRLRAALIAEQRHAERRARFGLPAHGAGFAPPQMMRVRAPKGGDAR